MTSLPSYTTFAFPRFRELTIATASALLLVAGASVVADTAFSGGSQPVEPAPALAKSDRLDKKLPGVCQGEAWGSWSADCLAELSGGSAGTPIRTVTVETRNAEQATSTLTRIASR